MNKRVLIALVLAVGLLVTACSGGTDTSSQEEAAPSETASSEAAPSQDSAPAPESTSEEAAAPEETAADATLINVAGSTSVGPLMEELVIAYEENGGVHQVEIQQTGSSAGITAAIDGAADLGMSSRDLKDEELAEGLVDTTIAIDGIAVIVNSENTAGELTSEQITAIFKGEITNWSEVGGEDGEIIVISREEGSGTRGAFEELMGLEEKVDDGTMSLLSGDALFENSTGAVKSNVSTSKNAIGYISLGSLDDTVTAVSVDGTPCTVEDIKSGAYPIARPFLVCTVGEPQGAVKEFVDYILSDAGQAVVVDHNYISVQ